MSDFDRNQDFAATAARLRDERPQASALELDDIKRRVLARRRRGRAATFARTRAAIVAMLVAGFALSGTGAGLAVSGTGDQASIAQYGNGNGNGHKPSNKVLGGEHANTNVQPERQVVNGAQASGSSLPFTGFAAIPVLLLGLILLVTGLVFRRSARHL